VKPQRSRLLAAPLIAITLAGGLAACGDDGDDTDAAESAAAQVTVTEAWVRQPAEGQTRAAAYGVITNSSGSEITLVGASAPIDATIEIHETMMDDGVMSMQERTEGFAIAAGATFTLEPGGPHVMMLGIEPTDFGETLDIEFLFDGADPVTVTAELRSISGEMEEMEMDDGDMDDTEMEDGDGG